MGGLTSQLADADRRIRAGERLERGQRHLCVREREAPAHIDAEVLAALGRLARAERLVEADVRARLDLLGSLPVQRQLLPPLLSGAWARRADLRLVDALYVELAHQLDAPLVTTDQRLARATPLADPIAPDVR